MDTAALRESIQPFLDEPLNKASLRVFKDAMTDPEAHTWDRPWLPNRYLPESAPGIEAVWDDAAPALTELLGHEDELVRVTALLLATYAPSPLLGEAVRAHLAAREPTVAVAALNALAEVGDSSDGTRVTELLAATHPRVRQAAASALGKLGGADQVDTLAHLADDRSPEVCYWAMRSLGEIGGERARELLLSALRAEPLAPILWHGLRDGLFALGSEVSDALLAAAEDADVVVRARALEALAHSEDARVEPALRRGLEDDAPPVSAAAAWALETRGADGGRSRLRELLNADDPAVALLAAGRMASLGRRVGLLRLVRFYFDPSHGDAARTQLALLPFDRRRDVLPLLHDPTASQFPAVADLVGAFGLAEGTERLGELASSDELSVGFAAAVALCRFLGKSATPIVRAVLDRLDDPVRRLRLASGLRDLWPPLPAGAIEAVLVDPCAAIVLVGVEALVHSDADDVPGRLAELLVEEADRVRGDEEPRPREQNEPVLAQSDLPAYLATREQALLDALPESLRDVPDASVTAPWSDPSVALCRVLVAGLVAMKAAAHAGALFDLATVPSPILRYRAVQGVVALEGLAGLERLETMAGGDAELMGVYRDVESRLPEE